MPSRVTLQTVADRLGVSRMTVSNAFSRPDQLSDEMRRKVLAAAEELGYAGPDPSARALAKGRTGAIGVVLTDSLEYAFTDQLATDLMAAITCELQPSGVALTLLTSDVSREWVPARDVPLDGALVFSCKRPSIAVDWLRRRKLPMVFVDQEPVDDVACVNIDEFGGARAAAQHLVDLGHRKVAIVTAISDARDGPISITEADDGKYTNRFRMRGWLDALTAAGIEPKIVNGSHDLESSGEQAAYQLLTVPVDQRPTGVLCFADTIAVGVMRTARRLGISIPNELSVVGFDDARFAQTTEPPLTTVHQDVEAKGRTAAAALLALINNRGETVERPLHVVLPTHLVPRQSTAPPRR